MVKNGGKKCIILQYTRGIFNYLIFIVRHISTASASLPLPLAPHDLVMCKVASGEMEEEHFMMVTDLEFLLVDPHKSKLGIGVVHFIAFLQVCRICLHFFLFHRIRL